MRPINIRISAFGPYKDEVYVDFTKFYDSGIFLVTGDTGSGKTTIFDAICFALFGNASGSNRDKNSFRSDFASDEVKTYVILEFSHKNIVYKIERSPSYMRKKKRGEGLTQVSGDASLVYLDKVITGDKNVTDKCIEILGINYSQFKQISMIAQGEFLKLLLAKPSDRADIFRRIFDTGIYKNISDSLKRKYLDVKRDYEDEILCLDNLKDSVIWDKDVEDLGIKEFLGLVDDEIKDDKKVEDKLVVNKTNLLNKIQNITSNIDNANIVNSNFDKYETINNEKEDKLKIKNDVDNKREVVKKNKEIYDNIMPLYDNLLKNKELVDNKIKELNDNEKVLEKVNNNYSSVFDKYKVISKYKEKLEKLKIELNELESKLPIFNEIDNLNKELEVKNNIYNILYINELNKLLDKVNDNKKLNESYILEENKFLDVKIKYNNLSDKYNLMYNKFINCQAGIIASSLKEGCACPVCGSLDHPDVAVISGDMFTKEELDKIHNELNECQKELEIISKNVSSLGKELELSNKEVSTIDEEDVKKKIELCQVNVKDEVDVSLYNIDDVSKDINYIKASIESKRNLIDEDLSRDELNSTIEDIKKKIEETDKYINDLTLEYEEITKEKVRLESVIKMLNKDIENLNKEMEEINVEYINKYKEYGYKGENEYLKVKFDKDKYLEYEEEVNNYDKELSLLESNMKIIEELIKDKERIDTSKLEIEKEEKNSELSDIEMSLKNIHSKINNNELVYDKINDVYKKIGKTERMLSMCEDLSNTANGNIKGKNKLEFEQYVQAYYFDNVLMSANKRFSYMTDSRYLLTRKVEASKISDKLGLELEVIDNYTGKRREVSSLSGGESFKASLALALGISDVIQSYAGGIVVEAMFIDEGFGSLDSESLEQAMNAISMLSNNNGLIGIISHVNELKDRIDKKIVVKKSNSGSSVSVVV